MMTNLFGEKHLFVRGRRGEDQRRRWGIRASVDAMWTGGEYGATILRSWSRAVNGVAGGAIPRAFALSGGRGRMHPFTNLHANPDTAVVDWLVSGRL